MIGKCMDGIFSQSTLSVLDVVHIKQNLEDVMNNEA